MFLTAHQRSLSLITQPPSSLTVAISISLQCRWTQPYAVKVYLSCCVCLCTQFSHSQKLWPVLLESKLPCIWFGSSVLLPLTPSLSPDIKKLVPSFKKKLLSESKAPLLKHAVSHRSYAQFGTTTTTRTWHCLVELILAERADTDVM